MTVELRLPELAESMTSAIVTRWLKRPGDFVTKGEPVVEVDIDKTTVELEAPASGLLVDVSVPDGTEDVPVGALLATIDEKAARPAGADVTPALDSAPSAESRSASSERAPSNLADNVAARSDAVDVSPLARRMAELLGIDLFALSGTGPNGRIQKRDIDRSRSPRFTPDSAADRDR